MANTIVKDYVTAVNQFATDIGADADNIDADVTAALAKIQALQDSQGEVTAEDQGFITDSLAILTGLKAKTSALKDRIPDEVPPPIDPPPVDPPVDPQARRR